MTEATTPLLVYNRIEANIRRTRLLLTLFAVALVPFVSGVAAWLLLFPVELAFGLLAIELMPSIGERIVGWVGSSMQRGMLIYAGLMGTAFLLASLGLALVTAALISRYSSALVLRAAKARPVSPEQERGLYRVVESVCVGAGLPTPSLHIVESSTPNAFATGRTPEDAALVVTRGLLTLLSRRELEGVIAHELSHIGNQDIRLNTTLAGLVGMLTVPLNVIVTTLRLHPIAPVLAMVIALPMVWQFLAGAWWVLAEIPELEQERTGQAFPSMLWWLMLYSVVLPFYMVLVAPFIGRLLKRGVSRERELLADADAVALTRNPEALALALIKVGTAHGTPIKVGPATTHLYFVDPVRSDGSWLAAWFRSHPPLNDRVELLFRMGSGVRPSAIQGAIRAGAERVPPRAASGPTRPARSWFAQVTQGGLRPVAVGLFLLLILAMWPLVFGGVGGLLLLGAGYYVLSRWLREAKREPSSTVEQRAFPLDPRETAPSMPLPVSPEPEADAGARIHPVDTTPSSESGASMVPAEEAEPGQRLYLAGQALLYSRPDGWSTVVEQLPRGTAITLIGRAGGFLHVTTDNGTVGYVGLRTHLNRMADH